MTMTSETLWRFKSFQQKPKFAATPSSYRPLISTNPISLLIRPNDILIHISDSYATTSLENEGRTEWIDLGGSD